jgi:HPt (histidine-containing phosphotransfer) domain-containing protein
MPPFGGNSDPAEAPSGSASRGDPKSRRGPATRWAINRLPPRRFWAAIAALSPPPPNTALRELASLLGDDSTREIVRLFLRDFPESISRMGAGSQEEKQRIVHGLSSSALHMGAHALSERLAAVEDRLKKPNETVEPEELASVASDFEAIAGPLRKYAGA